MWNIRSSHEFKNRVIAALTAEMPYFELSERYKARGLPKKNERMASVLMLISFSQKAGESKVLFTERSHQSVHHPGQISFPGGAEENEDIISTEETVRATALRETQEEVGIDPTLIEVLGDLPPLPTFSSSFWVTPVVGLIEAKNEIQINVDPREVNSFQWISIDQLVQTESLETLSRDGKRYQLPLFDIHGYRIWGLTAVILSNFLKRLHRVGVFDATQDRD